ncbi:MAG: hypothetical protein GXX96_14380 [Planctomycetaceae bacterium]|nr:hypothetical protein [Planctomycetaceae bacterium]
MDGRVYRQAAAALVVVAMLGCVVPASAQVVMPLPSVPDPGYFSVPQGPAVNTQLASTSTSSTSDKSLAEQIAELQAWQAKVEASEAAAKKKAAGAPTVKIGGRIFADTAMFSQNAASVAQGVDAENGLEMRAAWLDATGSAFDVIGYKLQFDLSGQTSFKDVFLEIKELPVLNAVRIGHFKEPFGLEQMTATKYTSFMERSLGDAGVFVPARNMGVMAYDCSENERMTWAIGAFASEQGDKPPATSEDHAGTALTMRTTFLPWYDEATEGRGLLHTGVAYSYRAVGDETLQLRARPEAHLGPYILDTGTIDVDNYHLAGAELAYVYGPFSAQSELFHANLDMIGAPNVDLDGCYVFFSYFLTGETRPYKRNAGAFNDRVRPHENFFRVRGEDGCAITGKGAWEILYRYSYVDLNDGVVAGGRASDHTFGLNWYLTPYTRMMFNYVHSTADRGGVDDGVVNVFEMRAQVDF